MIEKSGAINVEVDGILIVSSMCRQWSAVTYALVKFNSNLRVTGYNRCDLNTDYKLLPGLTSALRIYNMLKIFEYLFKRHAQLRGWNPIPIPLVQRIVRVMIEQLY